MYVSSVKVDAKEVGSTKLEAMCNSTQHTERKVQKPKREEDFS